MKKYINKELNKIFIHYENENNYHGYWNEKEDIKDSIKEIFKKYHVLIYKIKNENDKWELYYIINNEIELLSYIL